ncbi:MAG: 16S rRNA (guanine(527)-N(7))-methyltransferase RsmG [Planctomyces sp.]|nr:16S rRNA (guanine(527)-N(7))-methyltransferase RsmG [Planctomyces sp.]MBA4120217.1 16S rRNA (guanine(527)-N(7))-methyltransferase RsmG [Isosphaera sp.]
MGQFLALLLDATQRVNLTAITDPAQAWLRHALDALSLLPVLASIGEPEPAQGGGAAPAERATPRTPRVIDVGSGGGVPGIPLAIAMGGVHFSLLEPTGKKAAFLEHAARALGLSNVRVLADRAEKIGHDRDRHREVYDAAVCRAVGPLAVVAELCAPLVRVGGVVLAVKGARAEAELAESAHALRTLGLAHETTITTPTGRLIVLVKARPTPRTYPRADGEPKRSPLGPSPAKGPAGAGEG